MDELLWLRRKIRELENSYIEKLASGTYEYADKSYFEDVGSRFQLRQVTDLIDERIKSYNKGTIIDD